MSDVVALDVLDLRALAAICPGCVTYPVASPPKRFARDMQGKTEMSLRQRSYLWRIAYTYRRQVDDEDVLAVAESRMRELWAGVQKARADLSPTVDGAGRQETKA